MQVLLEYHFCPDHSPPTITTTQITYRKRKQDTLHLCIYLEQGGAGGGGGGVGGVLWGQSPWGNYTMNHKIIVNVFDTSL